MPKLWNETIASHRRDVSDAILDTTAALVAARGMRSVTMARIARETGIGRATLYHYFPDVTAVLYAWHERQVDRHLALLADARDRVEGDVARLEAVLVTYGSIVAGRPHGTELAALVHREERLAGAYHQLRELVRSLVEQAVAAGHVRDDIAPGELANYCLHALNAASGQSSIAAVDRLVQVVMDGLRPPSRRDAPPVGPQDRSGETDTAASQA